MKLRKTLEIPEDLKAYIKSSCELALVVKRRIYREWYSDIRTLLHDIHSIETDISLGCASIDDQEEYRRMVIQLAIYKNLLRLFGQNPDIDPEHPEEVLS